MSGQLENALIRVMFVDICRTCVHFPDPSELKQFREEIYNVFKDYAFTDKELKRAQNIWQKRRYDIRGLNAAKTLLFLYHFTLFADLEIIDNSYLNRYFEELSQHIPDKYFPTNEKQTDSIEWLECKGEARKMLKKMKEIHEVFNEQK